MACKKCVRKSVYKRKKRVDISIRYVKILCVSDRYIVMDLPGTGENRMTT